jgi:predicted nuclease of predicted toxin-antitoxin system
MNILLDECLDWRLGRDLPGHSVRTVQDMGWQGVEKDRLLALAQSRSEVFITGDRNLSFRQNLSYFSLSVVVLQAQSIRLVHTRPLMAKLIIDSLNEDENGRLLPSRISEEKGIAKFERFLAMNGIAAEQVGTYMRRLYGLRHGVGHRKGDSYERAAELFGVGRRPLKDVFVEILIAATELLQLLDRNFLGRKED